MPEVTREHPGSGEVFGACGVRDVFAGSACASRQIERADLLAGMREQMRDVMEPLCVLESCGLAFVGDGPEVAFTAENRLVLSVSWMLSTLSPRFSDL